MTCPADLHPVDICTNDAESNPFYDGAILTHNWSEPYSSINMWVEDEECYEVVCYDCSAIMRSHKTRNGMIWAEWVIGRDSYQSYVSCEKNVLKQALE